MSYPQQPQNPPQPPRESDFKKGIGFGTGACMGIIIACVVIMGGCVACGVIMMERQNRRVEQAGRSVSEQKRQPEKPKITLAKFNKLKDGMSYKQVVEILGSEGTEISSNSIGGYKTVMYKWDAGFMANMNAMFQNDKLISKSQFGLE